MIFDNYNENSIKSYERSRRSVGVSYPDFKLNINSPLPAREKIMKNSSNKRILINLLCNYNSVENVNMIGEEQNEFQREEADVSIISYLFLLFNRHQLEHIQIKADDTDIFLLLLHYYWSYKPDTQITMKTFGGNVIDINATSIKLGSKCSQLLAMHALTSSDSTSYPFNKGKISGLKILKKHTDIGLERLGNVEAEKVEIRVIGNKFFSLLYSSSVPMAMNKLRYKLFSTSRSTPDIRSLPPTDEALFQHILRSHYQVLIWKSVTERTTSRKCNRLGMGN